MLWCEFETWQICLLTLFATENCVPAKLSEFTVLSVFSSFAIILMGKRELVALL